MIESIRTTRREFLALPAAVLAAAGCARTPPGVAGVNATRLTWKFTMNGPVDPSYIYMVAIRVLSPPVVAGIAQLSDPTQVPIPVIGTGSKNGIVDGEPTHYVIYAPAQTINLYQGYQFLTQEQAPDSSQGPGMNLAYPGVNPRDVIVGTGLDPTQGDPLSLGFTIDTSYLDQFVSPTQQSQPGSGIETIQFNIITTNIAGLNANNLAIKVTDSCGGNQPNSFLATALSINLAENQTYTDQTLSLPASPSNMVPIGANLPPVQMTSWSLTVTPQ